MGLTVVVLLAGAGAYLAYENTLPTTVSANFKSGQKDVPTDSRFVVAFTRPVSLATLQAAFSIAPAADGTLSSLSGQTQYAWTPSKPLSELTAYTVSLKPIYDVGHHRVAGTQWTFTTIIIPRVTAVTAGGAALKDGDEIDPGSTIQLTFNDAMEPTTIALMVGTKPATLKWASDDRSATFSTIGIPSGPLPLQIAAGGRDQSGHLVPAAFSLKTGVFYHDREHTVPLKYPALIQIPNDEFARDQNGLQAANMVFEYLAEGGITRLTAIYQNAPDVIGPMRSARFISLKLGRHYKGLLFQSGESQATRAREAQDPTPQFFDTIGYQYRTSARIAPDNLMIHGSAVQGAEQNYFSSISAFTLPTQRPTLPGGSLGTNITVDEHYSTYSYDSVLGTYTKTEEGHAYKDASSGQALHIEMLIILHTREQLLNVGDGHGAHIHDFDLDTSGSIQLFYKGQGYGGTWSSTDSHGPLTFTLTGGQVVTMPPGLVWVDVTQ